MIRLMKLLLPGLLVFIGCGAHAQAVQGFQADYLEDFKNTVKQLNQLAEAVPADKYGWRPGPGVRSFSEVAVHIASANYLLLSLTGVDLPKEYYPNPPAKGDFQALSQASVALQKSMKDKEQIVRMLSASLDAVRDHLKSLTPDELDKPANFFGRKTTNRGIYLRIFAHCNEHMGQLVAYARVNGITPPWSRGDK